MGLCLLQSQKLTGGFRPYLESRYIYILYNSIPTACEDSFKYPGVGSHHPCPFPCLSLLPSDLLSSPTLLGSNPSTNSDFDLASGSLRCSSQDFKFT